MKVRKLMLLVSEIVPFFFGCTFIPDYPSTEDGLARHFQAYGDYAKAEKYYKRAL
ncbi:hypothetical protein [Desulfosoma caldarium]|uniref:hypothetical protein n=1 Tax=Desulfosoma caldarium TaxID=610254 RepID=UPI001475C3F7|nr:hypothetical protein [Desulfosoma caldarium]